MEKSYTKIYTTGATVPLKIRPGHFATNHAHINYYIDVTTLKARTKEAEEVAQALVGMYLYDTVIDTIVCMEGTEVIGAFLAEELAKGGASGPPGMGADCAGIRGGMPGGNTDGAGGIPGNGSGISPDAARCPGTTGICGIWCGLPPETVPEAFRAFGAECQKWGRRTSKGAGDRDGVGV